MTNYNRFISYLNYYELGNKKGNVGFARVETSDEICKVTVHCALKVIPKKECRVYLLKRQTSLMLSKEVGVAEIKDGLLDVKLSYVNGLIDEDGFVFKDCIGIVLMYSKDSYIGAKWDGSNITYHEAELIEQNKNQAIKVVPMEDRLNEQPPYEATKAQEPVKTDTIIQVVPKSEVVVIEGASNASKDMSMGPKEASLSEEVKNNFSETYKKAESSIKEAKIENINNDSISEEKKSADVKQLDGAELSGVREQEVVVRNDSLDLSNIRQHESMQEDLVSPPMEQVQEEEDMVSVTSGGMNAMNPWVDHPAARAILNRFVRMYPFDDGEMAECVRLEPKDIGLFPMSAWVLGNNSFVLHSYSSFRHLLFAKKLTREGCEYYLMVPGFYTNREKQLAQMFGFEMFKGSRRRGPKGGEFGYWYVKILFE